MNSSTSTPLKKDVLGHSSREDPARRPFLPVSPIALPVVFGASVARYVHAGSALPMAVMLVLLTGAADFLTGADVTISFLYLVPIFLATWFHRRPAGVAVSALCTLARVVTMILTNPLPISLPKLSWNAASELLVFVVVVYLLDAQSLRAHGERAERATLLLQLRHAERLTTLGKLAAGVAHELGTPLNVLMLRAELIATEGVTPEDVARSARIIHEQGGRMASIIGQLLRFGRRSHNLRARQDLRGVAEEVVLLLAPIARNHQIEITLETCSEPVLADVNSGELQQVLSNLIMNAVQASAPLSAVSVVVGLVEGRPYVTVRDAGDGIRPADLLQIFDPFFTTKGAGEGTGLGLAVSYGIVKDHGGRIEVESEVAVGSTFTVALPGARG